MNLPKHIEQYFFIFLFSFGGLAIGFFIEKIVLSRLRAHAHKTTWKFDDVIIESLKGLIMIWFLLLGHSIAANLYEVSNTFNSYSNKTSASVLIFSLSVLTVRILIGIFKMNAVDTAGNSNSIILNIIRVVIMLIGFMLILQVFGISIAPLLTALGVGGLAVALALQETLSNLFAGIQLIASKKIRNGDYVKLDSGQEGNIMDITWRNTVIRAAQNNLIIIPNSKLSSAIITNYNLPDDQLMVPIDVSVSYDSDLAFVEKVTFETAKEVIKHVDGTVKEFEPIIRFKTFADSSINFTVFLRAIEFDYQFVIKHEFIKALHLKYKQSGIEIPYPVRTVVLKNPTAKN